MTNQTDLQPVEPKEIPIEEQISQELVKHNVTETLIADLKEKYLPLKLKDLNDKETYVLIKDARKECKSLRVLAKKICEKGREDAVAKQKKWIEKEKDVTGRIGEVEDHLEKQEKEFEAEQEKQKALRKRQQEEQLIRRQTQLTNMGALYSDGSFALGEVSFELSLVKECEDDIWAEQIYPKFLAEYNKVEAERLEADRKKQEQEAELQRQREEQERRELQLAQREAALREAEEEKERKLFAEAKVKRDAEMKVRIGQLTALGLTPGFEGDQLYYKGYDCAVSHLDITGYTEEKWNEMIEKMTPHVARMKEEAEQKRLAEIEEQKKIAARNALNKSRVEALKAYDHTTPHPDVLADMSDVQWEEMLGIVKGTYESKQREKWEAEQAEIKKQDEIKRQQEMDAAKDKERWEDIISQLDKLEIHDMRSGQYRKKAAILREKLEEVKAL